jgi:hypothetical protein
VPIKLRDGIWIKTIGADQLGAIIARRSVFQTLVNGGSKCIVVEDFDFDFNQVTVEDVSIPASYALNFFSTGDGLRTAYGFLLDYKKAAPKMEKEIPLASLSHPTGSFQIRSAAKPDQIQKMFEAASGSIKKDKGLRVTLSRFNAALLRDRIEDRIVDLSVCLESLFSSSTEIAFRFSLYNAIISTTKLEQRFERFKLLQSLYKDRSKLVHGEYSDSKITVDQFKELINIARVAIAYKIQFVEENGDSKAWQEHLDKLALSDAKMMLEEVAQ